LSPYVNAKFVWFQEEHKNSGGWTYVEPRIQLVYLFHNCRYWTNSRKKALSATTGSIK
jgi:2-oxoglutarate dehydrogenase complex dehydrogenase (E1) component-like enzyme